MKNTLVSQDVPRAFLPFLAVALALGPVACDDGRGDPSGDRHFLSEDDSLDGEACSPSLFPSSTSDLQAVPPVQQVGFDFDTGNGPIEVVIPSVIPVIFANVQPGDASIVLRFTTLLTNSWFDAVSPYHATQIGVYSDLGRRPAAEAATNANMNTAIFYASYRVLNSLAPQNAAGWDAMMVSVGLDPTDDHVGTDDAIGIGNAAGNAVVAARENDGQNQLGFDGGRIYNPLPYGDSTGYAPVNTGFDIKDDRRWQPRVVQNRYGITRVQQFVTPQWALTTPYSYDDPQAFGVAEPTKSYRKGPQAKKMYKAQADAVLAASANLTDQTKLEAELFDDKIRSLGFSALFITFSRGLTLMEFVQYDFLTNMAAWDAGIAVWQEKRQWDAVRPFTAVRSIYGDDEVTSWGGPGMGTVDDMPADQWKEYLNVADHPEYPSGSAAFCAAHAQASRLFLGSDDFGWTVSVPAGGSVVEPGITPAVDTDLHFDTWTDFMTRCGYSRFHGGVHFEDAILASFPLGTEIGTGAYDFVQAHIDGVAP